MVITDELSLSKLLQRMHANGQPAGSVVHVHPSGACICMKMRIGTNGTDDLQLLRS